MKHIVTLRAIIKKEQKILLVRRHATSAYELPGRPLITEDPRTELSEYLKAETGHAAQVIQLHDVITQQLTSSLDTVEVCLLFLVALEGSNEKLVLGTEYEQFSWEKMSKIQPKAIDEFTQVALQLGKRVDSTEAEAGKVVAENTTSAHEVIVYTDGGSRGNPGPSAAGFVIFGSNEELLFEGGKYLGVTTNNQAEYQAVRLGLEKALELGARVVKFRMDSLLIVNQMIGLYQIKNRDLWPIYASIKELVKKFEHVSFSHVRREFNQEADALVNKVLNEQTD